MSNRHLAAFRESHNLFGLVSTVVLALATSNILVLVFGCLVEAVYLTLAPHSRWYRDLLARRAGEKITAQRGEIKAQNLPLLRGHMKNRYIRLEEVRRAIDKQANAEMVWMREMQVKLDFLLEKFLEFAVKEEQFRAYLEEARHESQRSLPAAERLRAAENGEVQGSAEGKTPPRFSPDGAWVRHTVTAIQSDYEREVKGLQSQLDAETDENTRAILQKRVEVLQRRSEFIGRIGKIVDNLNHQLALLEDTFGLINDELLARPPEQVLADVEDVASQTKAMTRVLDEMAPYDRMLEAL